MNGFILLYLPQLNGELIDFRDDGGVASLLMYYEDVMNDLGRESFYSIHP